MARKRNTGLVSWGFIKSKIFRSHGSNNRVVVLHTSNANFSQELLSSNGTSTTRKSEFHISREDVAAITIQASFRRHLAKRAYKALRSLVKVQALVRGAIVRRQARIALQCMHALARLQITVRARQLLIPTSNFH